VKTQRAAALFDLYGTLVDLHVDEKTPSVWNAIAEECFGAREGVSGHSLRDSYLDLLELRGREKDEGFLLDSVFADLLNRFGAPSSPTDVSAFAVAFRRHSTVHLRKKPYTDALLSQIRSSGYKVGLISNTEELLTRYDLDVLQLEPAFDQVILSSRIGVKKPNERIFAEMLARLAVAAEAAVYVGNDFDDDVLGALNSGMDAVYLTSEPAHVRKTIRARYGARVLCAEFSLDDICTALADLGFELVAGSPLVD
jgi:putative hydrolase of the HAD superfamily